MRNAPKFLMGSLATYVIVAACSGTPERLSGNTGDDGGRSGMVATEGVGGSSGASTGTGIAGFGGAPGLEDAGTAGGGSVDATLDALVDAVTDAASDVVDASTDPVPDAKANESGSRLKARYVVGADGARQFWGWYDTVLETTCTFIAQPPGQPMLCVPAEAYATLYYRDSGCAQPAGVISTCTTPPDYVAAPELSGTVSCPSYVYRGYSVGASYAGDVYTKTTTGCSGPTTNPCSTGACSIFALTAIPDSDLVASSFEIDE